jgi:hypothetical protein
VHGSSMAKSWASRTIGVGEVPDLTPPALALALTVFTLSISLKARRAQGMLGGLVRHVSHVRPDGRARRLEMAVAAKTPVPARLRFLDHRQSGSRWIWILTGGVMYKAVVQELRHQGHVQAATAMARRAPRLRHALTDDQSRVGGYWLARPPGDAHAATGHFRSHGPARGRSE